MSDRGEVDTGSYTREFKIWTADQAFPVDGSRGILPKNFLKLKSSEMGFPAFLSPSQHVVNEHP